MHKLIKKIKDSSFLINIFSILHHSFIIRKGIYDGISKNKSYIKGKVLDFGCGKKPYKSIFSFEEYIGVDYEETRNNNSKNDIEYFRNGKELFFSNDTFDSILSTEVFEHIFNIDEILGELNRVLKKGGNLLITIPFVIHEHEIPYDFARYTSYGISHLLKKHGFKIIKSEKYGSYFQTILQLHIWFLGKITETKNKYITLFLRIFFVAPILLLMNIISLISPKTQSGMYLSNIIVGEKI